jgi:hypothetical protein
MSQAGSFQTSQEGGTEIWFYLSPVAESKQISIPNAAADEIRYTCTDYTNADYDATLFGSGGQSDGDAINVPATVASVPDGSVCVSCMIHGEKDQFASITVGLTLLGTPSVDEGAMQTGAAYSIQSGTADETHTYNSGGTADDYNWVMGAWEETSPSSSSSSSSSSVHQAVHLVAAVLHQVVVLVVVPVVHLLQVLAQAQAVLLVVQVLVRHHLLAVVPLVLQVVVPVAVLVAQVVALPVVHQAVQAVRLVVALVQVHLRLVAQVVRLHLHLLVPVVQAVVHQVVAN